MGPCSIHDPLAAVEYARRLKAARDRFAGTLEIVMRVYFEKPRTTVGWKGLINDPYLDESYRIDEGLRIGRQLLLEINRLGMPAGSEFLDVISPQYIGDLIAWGAIGARTTESQVHRELASGLSAPIGFKNGTDGNIRIAIDAIRPRRGRTTSSRCTRTARSRSSRRAATRTATSSCAAARRRTTTRASIAAACAEIEAAKLPCTLMVDCSHANSSKDHRRQIEVARDIAGQLARRLALHLRRHGGEPPATAGRRNSAPAATTRRKLAYGQSITDACLGWDDSLGRARNAERGRRSRGAAEPRVTV